MFTCLFRFWSLRFLWKQAYETKVLPNFFAVDILSGTFKFKNIQDIEKSQK